jgi:two-component system, chemotaxis family, sensor kinase CheA
VRNAVAHGIESSAARAIAGKQPIGRVEVTVVRRGNRVSFMCRDDGSGIDVEAVRRAAVKKGLVSAQAKPLGADELLPILLKGGLTTAGLVTEMSGRGIGLDIVREAASRLGGEVFLNTEAGRGTSIELLVPVSLASLDALLVEAGGVTAAIPLSSVRRTLRVTAGEVLCTAEVESVKDEGKVIPFIPLARPLRVKSLPARSVRAWSAVVVDGATALAAVGVDRILGTANLVVRPLPLLAPADPAVAGAFLDAEGTPQLVLDPEGLVAAASRPDRRPAVPDPLSAPPLLIIDDSLTTRKLEQSILESAGYEVDLATSAEEAFEMARERRYGLFLTDVEMPGIDGFMFVEKTRSDPALRDIPAILVTSRNSPEDRRRGEEVGASAYIVKSEFDQGQLLETIRRLVG